MRPLRLAAYEGGRARSELVRAHMPPVGRAGWCQRLHGCWRRHIASTKERPMAVSFQLVIDCADPEPLARFWAAALGYELEPPHRIPSSATRLAVGSTLSGQHDLASILHGCDV